MEELYKLIEEKIKKSGYPEDIDGEEFYEDVCNEAEDQELGKYLFFIKKSDDLYYEGCMDIMEDQFDLHFIDIHAKDQVYHVEFDD